MERHVVDAEFIVRLDSDGDFFDGVRAIVVPGTRDDDVRRVCLARLDEEIVGQAHGLPLIQGGDVVHAVLRDANGAFVDVALAAREANLLFIVKDQDTVAHRPIGFDFKVGIRAFDSAEVAAAFLDHILHPGPLGIAVRHADILHTREVQHANIEVARTERSSLNIVFDTFGKARENELEAGGSRLRAHGDLIPFGSALIPRVKAHAIGLQANDVRLYARYESTSKWDQVPMRAQAGASGFQFVFAGLPESVEYYVEAGPLRSRHFNIRVLDLPGVKNVRVTYRYPEWTRLQNVVEERGGDLRAVEGTDADLEIETDRPLRDGVLVLDNEEQIRPSGGQGNVYKGTTPIPEDGVYHVAALDQGQRVRLSNDFFIEARKADPPNVIIARPGHDYRSSPIEEVTVAIKADDEFGIYDMTLHYSVNGGAEQTVDLLKQKGVKQADGSTVISLENFKLVPGDVVSLYAIAKDARSESRTDISFIQADPFE